MAMNNTFHAFAIQGQDILKHKKNVFLLCFVISKFHTFDCICNCEMQIKSEACGTNMPVALITAPQSYA